MCELLKEGIFYGIHGNEWCLMGQTIIGTRLMRYDSPPPPPPLYIRRANPRPNDLLSSALPHDHDTRQEKLIHGTLLASSINQPTMYTHAHSSLT